jgi:hypothetical protein
MDQDALTDFVVFLARWAAEAGADAANIEWKQENAL